MRQALAIAPQRMEVHAMTHLIRPEEPRLFSIQTATKEHIPDIVELINNQHAANKSVLLVSTEEVAEWVNKGHSRIAVSSEGKVIGHQSLDIWPESGWGELRACVVTPDFQGRGINSHFTRTFIDGSIPGVETFVVLKNCSSKGTGTFTGSGFTEIPEAEAPKELFTIGGEQKWTILKYDVPQTQVLTAVKR